MEQNMKIVLLCHYWSEEMAEIVGRKHFFRELSPWIQEKINHFKGKSDVELHVVAPNYASNTTVETNKDNIHYHFYHYSPTHLSRLFAILVKLFIKHAEIYKVAERLANTLTGFRTPTKDALKIVRSINPNLIHLYGSENPDYAAPAIRLLHEYPVLLTPQGYVYLQQSSRMPLGKLFYKYRVKYERIINCSVKYVTAPRKISVNEIKNNDAHYFCNCKELYYITATTKIPLINALHIKKEYDLVYYARIDKNKGIEDLISAISLLKYNNRSLKTLIMGRGSESYENYLKRMIKKEGLDEQIEFAGFIENHEDVYIKAAKARLLVLPTHNDGIPNTIREAMFMKLPVVANNVGGIPRFNENRHCIHLVENGNINDLAEGILKVLDDKEYQKQLVENAYREAHEVYSPEAVYEQTIFTYNDIVNKLRNN